MTTQQTNQTKTTTRKHPRPRKPPTPEAALNQSVKALVKIANQLDPEAGFQPRVKMLLDKPGLYDRRAFFQDGQELLSIKFVPMEQVGDLPALHARWQHASTIQSPSEKEAEALRSAEFIVEDYADDTGPFCYYREKKISHAWVIRTRAGWKWSRSRSVITNDWDTVTLSKRPVVPSLPGCPHNYRTEHRDELIEAMVWLRHPDRLPEKITRQAEFKEVMIMLWQSGVDQLEGRNVIIDIAQA